MKSSVNEKKPSNGKRTLPFLNQLDGRARRCARANDIYASILDELGERADTLNMFGLQIAQGVAMLSLLLEEMSQDLVKGEKVDRDLFNKISNNIRRHYMSLDMKHEEEKTPDLDEYLGKQDDSRFDEDEKELELVGEMYEVIGRTHTAITTGEYDQTPMRRSRASRPRLPRS